MSHFSVKTPPSFNKNNDDYAKWRKKLEIWQNVTEAPKTKQGGLLVLILDDQTQDTILEKIPPDDLKAEDAITKILGFLDEMFKKDQSVSAFETYEDFELYKRPSHVSMTEFCNEFERKLSKVKSSGTQIAEHVLAYRMLKSANITKREEQLVKATISKMTHADMAKQLKKVFSVSVAPSSSEFEFNIKEESEDVKIETFYGSTFSPNNSHPYPGKPTDEIWIRKGECKTKNSHRKTSKKKQCSKPIDMYGHIKRCEICESIKHLEENCPDRSQQHRTYYCQVETLLPNRNNGNEDELLITDCHYDEENICLYKDDDGELYYEIYFSKQKEHFKATGCNESVSEGYNETYHFSQIKAQEKRTYDFNDNESEGEHQNSLHCRDQIEDTTETSHREGEKEALLTEIDQSKLRIGKPLINDISDNYNLNSVNENPNDPFVGIGKSIEVKQKMRKSCRYKVEDDSYLEKS